VTIASSFTILNIFDYLIKLLNLHLLDKSAVYDYAAVRYLAIKLGDNPMKLFKSRFSPSSSKLDSF